MEKEPPDLSAYEPYVNVSFYTTTNEVISTSLSKVTAIGFQDSISFPVAATSFKFPLDINSNQTSFIINRASNIDTLVIGYESSVEDQFDILRFILKNPTILYHTYDSVTVTCDTICISNDAKLRLY